MIHGPSNVMRVTSRLYLVSNQERMEPHCSSAYILDLNMNFYIFI